MTVIANRPLPTMPQQSLSFRLTGNSVSEIMNRRASYKGKGKERALEDPSEPPSPSLYTFVPRPPSTSGFSSMSSSISPPTSPSSKRSSVLSTTSSSSSRSSALFELSPFKFTRKKKPPPAPRQNPNFRMNLVLPDVLEISAANSVSTPGAGEDVNPMEDDETRERVRLREEAAQALGLASSTTGHQGHSDDQSESGHSVASNGTLREEDGYINHLDQGDGSIPARTSEGQAPNDDVHHYHRSPLTSTTSLHPLPLSQTHFHSRSRSGSMPPAIPFQSPTLPPSLPQSLQQSSNLNPAPLKITPVPSFPSTPRALAPFQQTASSGTLPKYYPSSSLRIFTISKQWKARHLILTSPNANPLTLVSGNGTSHAQVSYLHLFKAASPDERELERLEINEDSVVFVSEAEVGGKKGVVQVAGVDVGFVGDGKKDRLNDKERVQAKEQTTWLFYIADPLEKQRWIESIKNKVFGQRTIRAGLGSSPPSSGQHEPRGDMDVMMSMRAQGIITSPAVSASHTSPTRSTFSAQELSFPGDGYPISSTTINSHSGHDAASMSSAKSSKNGRPSSPYKHASTGGAVLSLKGLFASSRSSVGHHSGRPRSASKTSRFDEMEDHSSSIRGGAEPTDSSVSVTKSILPKGNNLISILRASSPPLEGSSFGSILPGANSNMGIHAPAVDFAAIGINRPPLQTPQNQLDRKILRAPLDHDGERRKNDRTSEARSLLFSQDPVVDDTSGSSSPGTRTIRTYSASESFSLQPPPRKRWTSTSEINPSLVLDAPQSQTLQLQESPYIRDHRNLDDIDVLGGAPSIGRINTARNGSLTPEPISNGSPHTKRASGQSAYSFSFGTPPGSGNIDTEYRRRSLSSRSVRSGQSGRSVDTAEEEVEELDIPAGGSEGPLSGRTRRPSEGSGLGPYDGDKRASNSSGKRNSVGIASGKRWSRQLPKRLTPPSGPPPATPVTPPPNFPTSSAVKSLPKTPQSHPYSGAATERRASTLTTHSTSSSHSSAMSNLPNFSKRASVSSAVSALSANSTQTPGTTTAGNQTPVSGNGSHSRASSSHRSSLAPPPRPAPTFALPPAPDGETAPSLVPPPQMSAPLPSSHNKVFRESIASRAFRLSLMAPKPPPSGVLPPRPDELPPEYPASPTSSVGSRHRRSHSSNNSSGGPGNLYSIPGSPVAPSNMPSADAISRGTLPSAAATAAPSSTPSRGASIKQRLRILSAPAPASSPPIPPRSSARPTPSSSSPPGTPSLMNGSTPYLEKQGHDSSSFHALGTPTTPSIPIPKVHNFEDELDAEPEIPSLPPPPRRGSKRISLPEVEAPANQDGEANNATRRTSIEDANFNDTDKPLFSLSHPGSAISLGVVDA